MSARFRRPTIACPLRNCFACEPSLRHAGVELRDGEAIDRKLAELRMMYEPFVNALASYLLLTLPPLAPESKPVDNWQTSAGMRADQRHRRSGSGRA